MGLVGGDEQQPSQKEEQQGRVVRLGESSSGFNLAFRGRVVRLGESNIRGRRKGYSGLRHGLERVTVTTFNKYLILNC